MTSRLPLIGITVSNNAPDAPSLKYESNASYAHAVALAGGLPILLPQRPELAAHYVALCDGILLTGGPDPIMTAFGKPLHPMAETVIPTRQAFDLAILDALDIRPAKPALGVCLGMQFMSLHAGCEYDQHLGDTLEAPELHRHDHKHPVVMQVEETCLADIEAAEHALVASSHHQAVKALPKAKEAANRPVQLRVVAVAPDGVIEAVDDPSRPFYAGVQWHPERGGEGPLNSELFDRFVAAARRAKG